MIRALILTAGLLRFAAQANSITYTVLRPTEVVAEIELSSPRSDWAVPGSEAAVASVQVDNRVPFHIFVYSSDTLVYHVFLGRLAAGNHSIRITRVAEHSAKQSDLSIGTIRVRSIDPASAEYAAIAHAPVLFIRANTVGKFSDIPLLAYCERLIENGQPVLQYTIVFSNEDGGTSTRALMARWGRTTDIEYVYRAYMSPEGKVVRQIIQGPDHKDLEFGGKGEDAHPVLMPVTDNNMIGEGKESPLRFQILPRVVNFADSSREQIMDDQPGTYVVMSKELERENKLRAFGVHEGQKISDPRNYAFFEYSAKLKDACLSVAVHLSNGRAYSSDVGRGDYAIAREGWVRTTVELPPGTTPLDIASVEFRCAVAPGQLAKVASGSCTLERVNRAFFLSKDYKPGRSFWQMTSPVELLTGVSASFKP